MYNRHINTFSRNFYSIAVLLFLSLSLQSCARKFAFSNSAVVPAAQGSVKIKKDKNKNYTVNLHVIRLAQPQRLTPPKKVYIVWLLSEGNAAQNIGQVKTSSSLISNSLKGKLRTVTSFDPTGFMITAEDNENVQYPGTTTVLQTAAK